ncbi:hypothetical protein [Echinicola rosea]|uniref:Apea-like HEPN domain-containing protein n=1 Tax=Echinicola rosea TaxID=1807691 RepID=A0ABQ1VAI9_9BACT|nr:hypothetical protein [Echinicola rosea]GGF49167.1 hypothetical protein GCM10011339_42210 [Echinicola rosea]
MSIEQCAKDFLKRLAVKLEVFDADLELSYETDILSVLINNVRTKAPANNVVTSIINSVEGLTLDVSINLNDNISTYISLNSVEISYLSKKKETKFRIRNFVLSSPIGAIIPIKYIENDSIYKIPQIEKDSIERKLREVILYYGSSTITQEEFSVFFRKVLSGAKNTVIAVFNSTNKDFVKLYSKSYFLYLLKGYKTLFPSDVIHDYRMDLSLISSVNSSTNDFTQFFEVYDVIDEYHHANDILVKYLKLYQVIEYLITRTLLVKIQVNSSNQNLFLREMTSLAKYDDFDKSNFKTVFKTNETDLGNWFKGKLSSNATLKSTVEDMLYPNESKTIDTNNINASYNALLTLIYKLRNTVVHNKESEIHLTIHNIKLRPELLKLIKDLMLKLELILFKKVVDFEEVITYKNKNLALY